MDLQYFATRIPKEKFTMYALNPNKAPDKAAVFEKALGYNLGNYKELIDNIERNIDESKFVYKRNNGFGDLYEQEMTLKGPNGKTARVMTAWIDRGTEKQLTSVYIKKSKRGKENENRNV